MNRRDFLSAGTAGLALSARLMAEQAADQKPKRVGIIGSGWYGKCDLLRLIQVSPVEVVSLCDVDKHDALAGRRNGGGAAGIEEEAAHLQRLSRDAEGEGPRHLLVDTPDHWHALPMIAAVQSGADVWVQKPISVDVVEGQAMLAAARKHERVVQVGTQRRSTPHLMEAREQIISEGKLGKVGLVEIYCYYHMRRRDRIRRTRRRPPTWITKCGPARRPCAPTIRWCIRAAGARSWSTATASSATCASTCSTWSRWMLDLGWPKRISSTGGILVKKGARPTSPTRRPPPSTTTISRWSGSTAIWGGPAPDPKYPWGATFYGDKGTLKASVYEYDFTPAGQGGQPIHKDVTTSWTSTPRTKPRRTWRSTARRPSARHMRDFLSAIATRGKPVADIEQGHISTASCILANMAMQLGRTLNGTPPPATVVKDDEANSLLRRPYRAPWVHPEVNKV